MSAAGQPAATSVHLDFRVEPSRVVDLDNLVRPALAGLRDAGVFLRGYAELHTIIATKHASTSPGLTIALDPARPPLPAWQTGPELTVASDRLPVEGNRESKLAWRDAVTAACLLMASGNVAVDIEVRAHRSLEGLMKPIIDGLEAVLGSEVGGGHEFHPKDHLISWLRIRRTPGLASELRVQAGTVT